MSTDFEERLRAELAQVPVRAPRPGLARDAYRRYRAARRRLRVALAATGTAAVVAGAVLIVSGHPAPGGPPGGTTAVVADVTRALASTDAIEDATTRLTQSAGQQQVLAPFTEVWNYDDQSRVEVFTPAGQLSLDQSRTTADGKATIRQVDYRNRTWVQRTLTLASAAPLAQCGQGVVFAGMGQADPYAAANWKATIESGLKCGLFVATGKKQQIDGATAIELVAGEGQGQQLWIDASSYLPARVVVYDGMAAGPSSPVKRAQVEFQIDFRWLAPTPANLAQLDVPVPTGFRFVPKPGPAPPAPAKTPAPGK
jgi:hypothetical protein